MEDKTLNVRIKNKSDTVYNWGKSSSFIPLDGELIFYSDINKAKIGDGKTTLSNLPFLNPTLAESGKLVADWRDIDIAQTIYAKSGTGGVSSNSLKRPYLDGNGYYQDMVNNESITDTFNDGTEYQVSNYQYRMNFDSGMNDTYIDTHLGVNSSIYTRVQGDGSYLNTVVSGDGSFLSTSFTDAGIEFIANGDKGNKGSLNYLLLQSSYGGKIDSSTVPLVYVTHQTADSSGKLTSHSSANIYGFAYDSVRNYIGHVERDSNGDLKFVDTIGSGTPTKNEHVVNKEYADTKVTMHTEATTNNQVYTKVAAGGSNGQGMWDFTSSNDKNTIALRTSAGQLKVNETPTEDDDATSKKYVDANFSSAKLLLQGSFNGIDKSKLDGYDLIVITGYKENVSAPNKTTFVLTSDNLAQFTAWSLRTVADEWEYTLRMSVSDGVIYFYSTSDYSGSTIFFINEAYGIKVVA